MATPYVEEFDAECPGPRVIFEAAAQRGRDDLGVAHGRLSIAGDGSGVATRQRHGQGRRGSRARGDACKRLHSRASDVSGAGSAASPFAWVWIPTGATPPPPAPPAR